MVLYSGAGQSGLEAADELGREMGLKFGSIILLDTPVSINSALNNVDIVRLITGERFNLENGKIPSIGLAVPWLFNSAGGFNFNSFLGWLKVERSKIDGFGHLDFIEENNIPRLVDEILSMIEAGGE